MTKPAAPVRTLVVDDHPKHRGAMILTLEKLGHATREAGTVAEAVALLKESSFDLVITDMELPRIEGEPAQLECGVEVIRQARVSDPEAAVLAITGYGTDENQDQARQAGAFGYIKKGASLHEIREQLRLALEGRQLRRDFRRLE